MCAAAADLIPAFEELGRQFEASQQDQSRVQLWIDRTLVTRQIENGAPMDVFAAAVWTSSTNSSRRV